MSGKKGRNLENLISCQIKYAFYMTSIFIADYLNLFPGVTSTSKTLDKNHQGVIEFLQYSGSRSKVLWFFHDADFQRIVGYLFARIIITYSSSPDTVKSFSANLMKFIEGKITGFSPA